MKPHPNIECGTCSDADRRRFGCPVSVGTPWVDGEGEGYAGQGPLYYCDGDQRRQADAEPWERTCPQYYRNSPFYQSLFAELEDYKKGRHALLGELSHAHLTYLRIMESEDEIFTNYWEAKLAPEIRK